MIKITRFNKKRINQLNYQKRIESFIYLIIDIRLNLTFTIDKLNQFCHDFIMRYLNIINRIFKYIADIIEYNL